MELTIDEMNLLISALGTFNAEYGSEKALALRERVRELRARRKEECMRYATS